MDSSQKTGMIVSTLMIASILGTVSGFVWCFPLNLTWKTGLLYGVIFGAFVGLFFVLFQLRSDRSNVLQDKESTYVSGSMMGMIFLTCIVIGVIAGIIGWIF